MPDLLLTFDIGTTALKVGLFDVSGRVLAISTQEYELIAPRSGWAELPVERYWEACVAGTRECLQGHDGQQVRAIGFSSQGQTFVPLDEKFRPLRNAIVWLDVRAADQAERIKAHFGGREREAAIGVIPIASGPKMLWLRENEPEVFERTAYYMMPPDYITWRLTGQRVGDPCDLGSTAMMDRHTRRWWPPMLDFIGVREEQLPRIGVAGEPVGRLLPEAARELDLSPEAVCVVGANDQTAGMIGTGNVRPGVISATIGTALAIMATTDGYMEDPTGCVMTGYHAVPGKGMVLSFTQTGAMALTWWRDGIEGSAGASAASERRPVGRRYEELIEEAMQAPPGCDGLLMLPHLTGTACPDFNANARGAFVGLSLSHKRAHMIRAILEAVAYCLREHVERIREFTSSRSAGVPPARTGEDACPTPGAFIRALGGGAKSDAWLQMMADVTAMPIERSACEHAASLGAAAMAAVGAGYFDSIEHAADAYFKAERRFEPEAELFGVYDETYRRFEALYQILYTCHPERSEAE
jgi:sugar (pentulose or hexulose) kinase